MFLVLVRAAFLAERQEVLVRVLHVDGLVVDPRPPFAFEHIDIPARRETPGLVVRVGLFEPQRLEGQGDDRLSRLRTEDDIVTFDAHEVIWHVVMCGIILDNLAEQSSEFFRGRTRATLVAQKLDAAFPFWL